MTRTFSSTFANPSPEFARVVGNRLVRTKPRDDFVLDRCVWTDEPLGPLGFEAASSPNTAVSLDVLFRGNVPRTFLRSTVDAAPISRINLPCSRRTSTCWLTRPVPHVEPTYTIQPECEQPCRQDAIAVQCHSERQCPARIEGTPLMVACQSLMT
ncbi:hypothetical protein KCU77_g31, partial [Aureobasidium melanogenum]